MKQCEARTVKGQQCKMTKNLVYLNCWGHEYLACDIHGNADFIPYRSVTGRWYMPETRQRRLI